jgi:hypothetical protein
MQTFLYYWKPQTVDYERGRGSMLDHSSSEQFGRVSPGDHVWHVTVRDGKLSVLGRIIVGYVGDAAGAAKLLGTDDLWESSNHIVAAAGTAEPVREVDVPDITNWLRFESSEDRLKIREGRVIVQQLQTMRILAPTSAAELEAAFRRAV